MRKPKKLLAWAVLDKDGDLVKWESFSDGEEGLEIHRTRKLAEASCMADEHVGKVLIEVVKL